MIDKTIHKLAAVILALCLSWGTVASGAAAEVYADEKPVLEIPEIVSNENGYIDIDLDVPSVTDEGGGISAFSLPPAKYDLRDVDDRDDVVKRYITKVKNQQGTEACWSFATINSLESGKMIKNGGSNKPLGQEEQSEPDYSEAQLAWFTYNRVTDSLGGLEGDTVKGYEGQTYLTGGNEYFAMYTLASWIGAVNESVMPFDEYINGTSGIQKKVPDDRLAYEEDVVHLKNTWNISLSDREIVKRMIMEKGAGFINIHWNDQYYNRKADNNTGYTSSYYCPEEKYANHAVSIIGWDDDYPKENFAKPDNTDPAMPEKNGAWLIKNSWGSDFGDGGCFWLSYEDKNITDVMFFEGVEAGGAQDYDNNYQYDGGVMPGGYRGTGGETTAAAVYTAQGFEELKAASFYTVDANCDYKIEVYRDVRDSSDPRSGVLAEEAVTEGNELLCGYHTIDLIESVKLDSGERYSIVISLKSDDKENSPRFNMDFSYDAGWMSCSVKANPGETFFLKNNKWLDLADLEAITARIKSFTDNRMVEERIVQKPAAAGTETDRNRIILTWDEVRGADGYRICLYDKERNVYDVLDDTQAAGYTFEGDYGTVYNFFVMAYEDDGGDRFYSDRIMLTAATEKSVASDKNADNDKNPVVADSADKASGAGISDKAADTGDAGMLLPIWLMVIIACISGTAAAFIIRQSKKLSL